MGLFKPEIVYYFLLYKLEKLLFSEQLLKKKQVFVLFLRSNNCINNVYNAIA
jgi:hypothetical protein